ncbi:hypothetical protein PHYBOEH_008011 [Phytophthora boehmeriae]|uniref:Transmembrane protein n=1 Tax=Phytophthora boehmeriae TaxID=109152 RepID=A0A8T1W4B6_9STRA|nr:hypothetical protein PHYBOEH_008011 [Phytophthora boehmeriae]
MNVHAVHPAPLTFSVDSRSSISRYATKDLFPHVEDRQGPPAHASRPSSGSKRWISARALGLRVLFMCLNIYTIISFVLTSSALYPLWPVSAAFLDDLRNGLYKFEPRTSIDRLMLEEMQAKPGIWEKYLLVLGYQDHHHNALGSASHCYRLGVDKGTSVVISYYGDGIARRAIHKFHGALPNSCTGYTVPRGHPYNSNEHLYHVNDARLMIGQSFLHCTDPVLSMTQRFDPSLPASAQVNNTVFSFKASYVIVQQHFANANYGVECQVSHCVARQVENAPGYWEVQPAEPADSKAYVNVIFTPKPILLDLLNNLGQAAVWFVILREVWRFVFSDGNVRVPTKRPPNSVLHRQLQLLGLAMPANAVKCSYIDAGASRLNFSRAWLASSLYMIGNVAHALGTTVESQMAVEVLFWQYTKSGSAHDLIYAGIYSLRHAWVGLALCSLLRLLLNAILKTSSRKEPLRNFKRSGSSSALAVVVTMGFLQHLRSVLLYVSAKSYILAFSIAAIMTVQGRGVFFLWDLRETSDLGAGTLRNSFWGSEIAHSLLFHHSLALVIAYFVALILRMICRSAWPGHERNSLIRAIDSRMWWMSFDVTDFLLMTTFTEDESGRTLFIARLGEVYQHFTMQRVLTPRAYFHFSCDKAHCGVFTHHDIVEMNVDEDDEGVIRIQARYVATDASIEVIKDDQEDQKTILLTIR